MDIKKVEQNFITFKIQLRKFKVMHKVFVWSRLACFLNTFILMQNNSILFTKFIKNIK